MFCSLIILLLIVGCTKDSTSSEPDCAGEINKHVELWGECYNIEETINLDLSSSGSQE